MKGYRDEDKKGKKEKKKYYKKKSGDAHVCREWDSDESSSDSSDDEDAANIAVTKGLLLPNVGHKCLMAKDGKRKKVKSKSSTKYASSSDEDNCSDEEDNLHTLFANLNMQQKEKHVPSNRLSPKLFSAHLYQYKFQFQHSFHVLSLSA